MYTERCFSGGLAPCSAACPLALDIRSFLEKAGKGRWNAAYKALRNAVLFPEVVCGTCHAPCESACLRKQTGDGPVAVNLVEGACVRFAANKKPEGFIIPPKTQSIAIVGAGIAGLSAALCLAQKKYPVTVFDKDSEWGGALRSHPRFGEFDADIALQFSATGAEFVFDTEITALKDLSGFDLIYLATGANGRDFGLLSGWTPELLTTREPNVFLGGALTGAGIIGAVAQGKSISKTADVFLQTGKASETMGESATCTVNPDYSNEPSSARIEPAGRDGYTGDEAGAEIARCFQCDCNKCMTSCEMLGMFRKKPKKIAFEVFTDTQANPPYSTHTLTRQTYSCNMCGHCKSICPADVDIGALLQASRAARVDGGGHPEALNDFWLREMDFSAGEASFFTPPEDGAGYVFYPGCQLGAHDPEYVVKSYAFLRNVFGAGIFQGCCGAPAYWAGDKNRLDANLGSIREQWGRHGRPAFVFACATCQSMFNAFMPEIPRTSLYELLAHSDEIQPAHIFDCAAVFDPCNARLDRETERAVRTLAQKSGAELRELPEKNRCCGYGGHMRLANPKLYDTVTGNRAGMGDEPYIVYCVNCREVFLSRGKDCAHILDLVFGLRRAEHVPGIDGKHENALKVKRELSDVNTDMVKIPVTREWDALALIVSDDLAGSIDRKLISLSDIKEAIWLAEKTGDKFIDEADGVCQCSMEKRVLTYWVQYKKTDAGAFEVYDAYYHRMRVGSGEA